MNKDKKIINDCPNCDSFIDDHETKCNHCDWKPGDEVEYNDPADFNFAQREVF